VYLEQPTLMDTQSGSKIRCLVVDDHILLRQGLRRLLADEHDIEVIGEAGDAAEALRRIMELHPDVVLMDIGMPGFSSFEATRVIQANYPRTRVVFLTMHEDQDYVRQGMQAGGAGYVLKDTPADMLVNVLREVHRGRTFVIPEALRAQPQEFAAGAETPRPSRPGLTPREREITKLLAEGNTVRKIAGLLRISMKTVEAHKFNLMRKLDVHNKAELVHWAIRKKLVKLPLET